MAIQQMFLGAGGASAPLHVDDVFNITTYTGTGLSHTINNGIDVAGKGGLVWLKSLDALSSPWDNKEYNCLFDNIRTGGSNGGAGGGGRLRTENVEAAQSDTYLSSYNSDGFTITPSSTVSAAELVNESGKDFVSFTFRKAPGFFDVVEYTGDGNTSKTIPHSLDSIPGFIVVKKTSDSGKWFVYSRITGASEWMMWQTNDASDDNYTTWPWNATTPTSTQFTVNGVHPSDDVYDVNVTGETYIAYLFAHDDARFGDDGDESIIHCGSFNQPSGGTPVTVTTGFEPQWIMIKPYDNGGNWTIWDAERTWNNFFSPNQDDPETHYGSPYFTVSSTGFTMTQTMNGQGYPTIYVAIAG